MHHKIPFEPSKMDEDEEEGCYICGKPDDTICDTCSREICFGCQSEGSTDCVECA